MKVKIGKYDNVFNVPNFHNLARTPKNESVWLFGKDRESNYTLACGIGLVKGISHGKEFDIVYMDFGRGSDWRFLRKVIVMKNTARRQIYTLKINQYAWFYGAFARLTIDGHITEMFYAKALQGWYVPKSLDIKKDNSIEKSMREMPDFEIETGKDFLSFFESRNKNDDDNDE